MMHLYGFSWTGARILEGDAVMSHSTEGLRHLDKKVKLVEVRSSQSVTWLGRATLAFFSCPEFGAGSKLAGCCSWTFDQGRALAEELD